MSLNPISRSSLDTKSLNVNKQETTQNNRPPLADKVVEAIRAGSWFLLLAGASSLPSFAMSQNCECTCNCVGDDDAVRMQNGANVVIIITGCISSIIGIAGICYGIGKNC